MKNWSTDINRLKTDPEKLAIWELEQMVNFGLDGEKLEEKKLKKYWDRLNIDPDKKKYLGRLIYGQ
ncbi:MAG: hypothetical protein M1383_00105 [Patescibacteria group bacterium]|nr:hypothetical protein [Patescibacteria group bacterium]